MTERTRIFWDSCVFVYLLSIHKDDDENGLRDKLAKQQVCKSCLQTAIDGKVDIFISTMTIVEVNKTAESTSPIPEPVKEKIKNLIDQPFVKVVSADLARAIEARNLIWTHSWLKPIDAMHLACALHAEVNELFTYDGRGKEKGLLDLNGIVGNPPLKICHPHFAGIQTKMPNP